jgi:hypothetical protein
MTFNAITQQGIDVSNGKAYRDATPGPGSAPEPGQVPPAEAFAGPYITEGQAADSPANEGMSRFATSWRAGVQGQGPVADRVANWRAAMLAVPTYGGEGSR